MLNKIDLFINDQNYNICETVDDVIDSLKKEIATTKDEELLKLAFSENPTQEELDRFLIDWDIEVKGAHKALMLSYFMKMHPNLVFPEYVGPRLNGLLKYFKFQNINLVAHFIKISKELQKQDIPFILLKGGAMKSYRPEFSRVMGDIDILVGETNFKLSGEIAEKLGYYASWGEHSVDIHLQGSDSGILDIHRFICMNTGFEKEINSDLFKRAVKLSLCGCEVLVPSKEDMVFISLVNLARNIAENTSSAGILYTLFDCHYLINSKPDFDWNIVKNNAIKTHTKEQICFSMKYINNIIPNLLFDKLEFIDDFEKELQDYYTLFLYQRIFLYPMKMRGHELTISKAVKDKDLFKEYIKLKPKYLLCKQKFIKKNPYITRLILNAEGIINANR